MMDLSAELSTDKLKQEGKCFLCRPEEELFIDESSFTYLVGALGPIADGHCIISSKKHVKSLADLILEHGSAVYEIDSYRKAIEKKYGNVLMTEHGRVPICTSDTKHDAHCFHAHAHFFPVKVDIEEWARSYFSDFNAFTQLSESLQFASSFDNYILISENSERFGVLTGPLNVPRQLTRYLVALALGVEYRADWRAEPNTEMARHCAGEIRALFGNWDE